MRIPKPIILLDEIRNANTILEILWSTLCLGQLEKRWNNVVQIVWSCTAIQYSRIFEATYKMATKVFYILTCETLALRSSLYTFLRMTTRLYFVPNFVFYQISSTNPNKGEYFALTYACNFPWINFNIKTALVQNSSSNVLPS